MRRECPREEAERRYGVEVLYAPLPPECGGAVLQRRPERIWIIVDPHLTPAEQRCRLAHELVHLDRGTSARCQGSPSTWDDVVVREELRVDREVAGWLVKPEKLELVVDRMMAAGMDVTAVAIAEHFTVTKPIARLALERLAAAHPVLRRAS